MRHGERPGIVRPAMLDLELTRAKDDRSLYVLAGVLGWFVHPMVAVAIFAFVVAFYAATSQGVRPRRPTTA